MTTKTDLAKEILELRVKIQLGVEVNIQAELDKLAIKALDIEPEKQYIPYMREDLTINQPIKVKPYWSPTTTPNTTPKYPYPIWSAVYGCTSESVE